MITKAAATYGIGDAFNQRAFLVTYCKQKNIPTKSIAIYTDKYWWMFKDLGFKRTILPPKKGDLVPYRNFGLYDLPKTSNQPELDACIAKNAGIVYDFETCVPLPNFKRPKLDLPEKFITFNTACGELSNIYKNKDFFCLKSWPKEYWEQFVREIGVPCVQVGAGITNVPIKGAYLDLANQLTLQETAEVMRQGLFHIDMEGGLVIMNQHLLKKSVVLFGPTAIQNQGRSFNMNLSSESCLPCYEWAGRTGRLFASKSMLVCGHRCMVNLKPDFVIDKIKKSGWLERKQYMEPEFIVYP